MSNTSFNEAYTPTHYVCTNVMLDCCCEAKCRQAVATILVWRIVMKQHSLDLQQMKNKDTLWGFGKKWMRTGWSYDCMLGRDMNNSNEHWGNTLNKIKTGTNTYVYSCSLYLLIVFWINLIEQDQSTQLTQSAAKLYEHIFKKRNFQFVSVQCVPSLSLNYCCR